MPNVRKDRWDKRGVLKALSNRDGSLDYAHPQVRREEAAAEPCGTCDGRGCPACRDDGSYEAHERAAGRLKDQL